MLDFRSPRAMFGRGRCYKKMALSSEGEAAADSMAAAARSFCHVVLRMTDVPKFLLMQSGQVGADDCYMNISST